MEQMELDLARAARDEGMSRVEANSHDEWMAAVDEAISWMAAGDFDFTSDDIRHVLDHSQMDEPHHANAWGARFAAAARRGLIQRVGYRQSARPAGHARAVAVWRGVGR